MQLEQQENFTIHGPQLEILGEVETKLPAPAKKRGTASIVLAALALLSVLGIGGAKLKGVYRETRGNLRPILRMCTTYGHRPIQGDSCRRRLTRRRTGHQTGGLCGQHPVRLALQEAEDALCHVE